MRKSSCLLETWFHHVAQVGLELWLILVHQPSRFLDYRCILPCLVLPFPNFICWCQNKWGFFSEAISPTLQFEVNWSWASVCLYLRNSLWHGSHRGNTGRTLEADWGGWRQSGMWMCASGKNRISSLPLGCCPSHAMLASQLKALKIWQRMEPPLSRSLQKPFLTDCFLVETSQKKALRYFLQ